MDKLDQTQKSSNSSSGGGGAGSTGCGLGLGLGLGGVARSSKKRKQKKTPQRGLGVAQLEKIRLEEQQKKDAAAVAGDAIMSPPPVSPSKSSFLYLPIPNYHHYCPPSSSIPFLTPSLADLSLPNLIINPPVQSVDARSSCSFPLTRPLNTGGFEVGWSEMSAPGHGGVPQLWNSSENNLERENSGLDPGLAFRSSLNFPFESDNLVWPPPTLMPRAQQPSHLMVNVSSGTTSSSALNFRMEPPSNQSYYGNYRPLFSEEEKMVGMKRPYPFSLENPPGPSFNCTFPTLVAPTRSEESASYVHGGTFNLEGSNAVLRGHLCSTSNHQLNSKESIKEYEVLHGDFLSLSSPGTSSTCPSSKLKNHSTSPVSLNPRFPDPESLPYQGTAELCQLNQQEPFYCFLPPAKVKVGQAATAMNDCHGEVADSTDLSLKL